VGDGVGQGLLDGAGGPDAKARKHRQKHGKRSDRLGREHEWGLEPHGGAHHVGLQPCPATAHGTLRCSRQGTATAEATHALLPGAETSCLRLIVPPTAQAPSSHPPPGLPRLPLTPPALPVPFLRLEMAYATAKGLEQAHARAADTLSPRPRPAPLPVRAALPKIDLLRAEVSGEARFYGSRARSSLAHSSWEVKNERFPRFRAGGRLLAIQYSRATCIQGTRIPFPEA
jgi:hypothetical protein